MFTAKTVRIAVGFVGLILLTGAISVAVSAWDQDKDKDDEGKLVEIGWLC
jgi:hypothetical protein